MSNFIVRRPWAVTVEIHDAILVELDGVVSVEPRSLRHLPLPLIWETGTVEECRVDFNGGCVSFKRGGDGLWSSDLQVVLPMESLESVVKMAITKLRAHSDTPFDVFLRGFMHGFAGDITHDLDKKRGDGTYFGSMGQVFDALHADHRAVLERQALEFWQLWGDRIIACGESFYDMGRDYHLSRERHGSGLWDVTSGDLAVEFADAMHETAVAQGEIEPYVGDDDKIYTMTGHKGG